jgi:hypothetical protein
LMMGRAPSSLKMAPQSLSALLTVLLAMVGSYGEG